MRYIYRVDNGTASGVNFQTRDEAQKLANKIGGEPYQVAIMDSYDEYCDVQRQQTRIRALSKLTEEEREALRLK